MADKTFLEWPFFEASHRKLAAQVEQWCEQESEFFAEIHELENDDIDAACRKVVHKLGDAGWIQYVVPKAYGGATEQLDVRSICIIRETLAQRSGLVEFCFAMQGLGVGPITLFGSKHLKRVVLPDIAQGKTIGAFAISEKEAGSDLSAMQTVARKTKDGYAIDGEKTWISNAGLAQHYVVFCRHSDDPKRFIALLVGADNPGVQVTERIDVTAPHPLGTLRFRDCTVSPDCVVGEADKGMGVALGTLDIFRTTVGAAALGFARCALDEAIAHTTSRKQFGQPLADFQLTQAKLTEMALAIDAGALLVYRAAWTKDTGAPRITREAAMAKLYATESAQKVVDDALQLFGARGVVRGSTVERLYREVRALRIYEGASEIQKLIIAAQLLKTETQTKKAQ